VHGRFFNSYRNFESSVKRIDSVKNACYSTNRTDKKSQELFTWEIRKRLDWRCLMMETKRDYYEVLGVSRNADEKSNVHTGNWRKNIIPIRMRETRMRKRNLRK
jgi:ethanolamine utilization protein EutP (predicted NTPase)